MMYPIPLPPPPLPEDLDAGDTVLIHWTVSFRVCDHGHLHPVDTIVRGAEVVRGVLDEDLKAMERDLMNPDEGGGDGSEEDCTGR